LRYANNDRHKRCLIVSKGALVRLTYVASGSVGKCCLISFYFYYVMIYKVKTKVKKSEDADDTNQITDRTKQNKR
ncbi:hypothetical protein T06_13063, partial [Trichinella sp. T6]